MSSGSQFTNKLIVITPKGFKTFQRGKQACVTPQLSLLLVHTKELQTIQKCKVCSFLFACLQKTKIFFRVVYPYFSGIAVQFRSHEDETGIVWSSTPVVKHTKLNNQQNQVWMNVVKKIQTKTKTAIFVILKCFIDTTSHS